jgi:hypothetical protein
VRRTRIITLVAIVLSVITGSIAAVPAGAHARRAATPPMQVTLLADGLQGSVGATIGPDGALYVPEAELGRITRIDPATGNATTFATGLPTREIFIGGAIDVAFVGRTAYVLVSLVGGDIVDGPHFGDATDGIYRLNRDGTFTVIADIGTWSAAHPPATDYFITTGVQYAMQPLHGGFLVTDGHHNRVLRVSLDGDISEQRAFDNIVPTGLDVSGDKVYMSELGPVPHLPQDGRVVAFTTRSPAVREVASGASMIVDVELGPRHTVFALSQGQWNGIEEGSPASPNTGRLLRVDHGALTPIRDVAGHELELDQPTSLELVGDTAYVVSLSGSVTVIDNVMYG